MPEFILTVTTSVDVVFRVEHPELGETFKLDGLPNGDAILLMPRQLVDAMETGTPQIGRVEGSVPGQVYTYSVRQAPEVWTPND